MAGFVRIGDLGARTEVDQIFVNAGVNRKLNLETPMAFVACDLVANGGGVSLVDELTANSYKRSGLIVRPFLPKLFFGGMVLAAPNAEIIINSRCVPVRCVGRNR
jgi:DNA-binding transcriptional LysR family regulator